MWVVIRGEAKEASVGWYVKLHELTQKDTVTTLITVQSIIKSIL